MKKRTEPKPMAVREGGLFGRVVTSQASAARAGFFPLLQKVASGSDPEVILISHKDLTDGVALVNAKRLRQSQDLLETLLADRRPKQSKFRLVGSASMAGDAGDVIAEVALRRKAAAAGKFDDL